MLALPDAVALSVWPKVHSRRLADFLRAHLDGTASPDLPALTLSTAIEAAGGAPAEPILARLREDAARAMDRAAASAITPIPLGERAVPSTARAHPGSARRSVGARRLRRSSPAGGRPGRLAVPLRLCGRSRHRTRRGARQNGRGHRQRPRPGRRFGRAPGRPAGGRHHGGGARLRVGHHLPAGARGAGRFHCSNRRGRVRVASRHPAARPALPGPQPDHQRSLPGGRRRRGRRTERVADHRGVRRRAGADGHGGSREHLLRPVHGVSCLDSRRRRYREFGGRGRVGIEHQPAPGAPRPAVRKHPCPATRCSSGWSRAKHTTSTDCRGNRAFLLRFSCPGCWNSSCRERCGGATAAGSFGSAERAKVGRYREPFSRMLAGKGSRYPC